ncbi:hypothetical protein LOT_1930 [Lentilactobacillus otakiensis DSM 19908 = JCM 15040]|uniref:Uncharacterized protein n=1 Tax=Lentilactobacillus otakiensis DSM 19908 = JCM 15040 TaxID=1423780 RepID=S4NJA5_9LACO|nr:hypothetical protein LOT_1930 [Lentilactobacillus otakiensis DSM 19908 = JCM 15040]
MIHWERLMNMVKLSLIEFYLEAIARSFERNRLEVLAWLRIGMTF